MLSRYKLWLIFAFTISACDEPQAQDQVPKLTNSANSQFESLCQELTEIRQAKQIITTNYCGVIIPSNDTSFTLPDWVDIDPKTNIDVVKSMYFWHAFDGGTQGTELYKEQLQNLGVISPGMLELFWPKAEGQIIAFIENGEVTLQSSNFDIDGDNVDELIYRMTPIVRLGGAAPPWEQDPHRLMVRSECTDFGLPGGEKRYLYYSPPSELPMPNYASLLTPFGLRANGFFKWNGESLMIVRRSLIRAAVGGEYGGATDVCPIN